MDGIKKIGGLTRPQIGQWDVFKKEWDNYGCKTFSEEWGMVFAQDMQNVLQQLARGDASAFSQWVHEETKERLTDTMAVHVPDRQMHLQPQSADLVYES